MGLTGSLQVGKSGLFAHQTAVQVAGNNLANAATPGYKRRSVELSPIRDHQIGRGLFVGQGVEIAAISRKVNEALESRLRAAITDENGSATTQDLLARIEAIQNELSGVDLSTRLGAYFDAWSQLTTNPQDVSLRTLVTQEAGNLANFVKDLRDSYGDLTQQVDDQLGLSVRAADDVLSRIADLNDQITLAEAGRGDAGGLRDQRDELLAELSKTLSISTVEAENGQVDVFVGSLPIILNGDSRGLEVKAETLPDGTLTQQVVIGADQSVLDISRGEVGAQVAFRNGALQDAVEALDDLAGQVIFQTNKLHSTGQGLTLRNSYTSTNPVADATASLNAAATGLDFVPTHGSFQLHLTSQATGIRTTSTVNVDLDGIGGADVSLNGLATAISATAGVTATVNSNGTLTIAGDSVDTLVSFSDDSSGVLAALGVNSFFDGTDAFTIKVNDAVAGNPALIAAAQDHLPGDNRTALDIAALRDTALTELGGLSLSQHWTRHIEEQSVQLSQAREQRTSDGVVRENLQTQQQALSGVNADEETINLIQAQRAYQASARFISVVDELMQTLINLV